MGRKSRKYLSADSHAAYTENVQFCSFFPQPVPTTPYLDYRTELLPTVIYCSFTHSLCVWEETRQTFLMTIRMWLDNTQLRQMIWEPLLPLLIGQFFNRLGWSLFIGREKRHMAPLLANTTMTSLPFLTSFVASWIQVYGKSSPLHLTTTQGTMPCMCVCSLN